MAFEEELKELQRSLAKVDLATQPKPLGWVHVEKIQVLTLRGLSVKMYQEPGHPLPHLHVDYGPDRHAASYALDGSGCLVGALDAKYDKVLVPWIAAHRESLLAWWHTLQLGADPRVTIGEIKGDA